MVWVFDDDDIIYVIGKVDLVDDIDMINLELIMVDFDFVNNCLVKV